MVEGKDCFRINVRRVGKWHGALAADVVFERSKPFGAPEKRKRALDLMFALAVAVVVPGAFAMWGLRDQFVTCSVLLNTFRK